MVVFLYTDDVAVLERWESLLNNDFDLHFIDNSDKMLNIHNSVMVIDADMSSGHKAIELAVKNNNSVLMLSRTPELEVAVEFIKMGVMGYGNSMMSKSFIHSAIESVSSGYTWLAPNITSQLLLSLSQPLDISKELRLFEKLTPTQKSIAHLLKVGLKNIEIAQKLDISINTVKKHIKDIYEKLGVNDRLSFNKLFL